MHNAPETREIEAELARLARYDAIVSARFAWRAVPATKHCKHIVDSSAIRELARVFHARDGVRRSQGHA